MKRPQQKIMDYSKCSKEELISRLQALESSGALRHAKKANKKEKVFDFTAYPTMHVALKIAYFGWKYNGFASQYSYKPDSTKFEPLSDNDVSRDGTLSPSVITVEDLLFAALLKTRLIESPRTCNYSRCGRTDAGVSSTGQVVALTLRSSSIKGQPSNPSLDIPICSMLNRSLPADIRVLGWSEVPNGFNARFDCIGRLYKYFFPTLGLDLDTMLEASKRLLGSHDFRNFCRKDASKIITNYERHIFRAEILPAEHGFSYFLIHGSAFLYHQVRCIMQVLLLVGRGLEPPSIIDYMLDITQCPERPSYDLAPEIPLVLAECFYPPDRFPLTWHIEESEQRRLDSELFCTWRDLKVRAMTVDLLCSHHSTVIPFRGAPGHKPIMSFSQNPK